MRKFNQYKKTALTNLYTISLTIVIVSLIGSLYYKKYELLKQLAIIYGIFFVVILLLGWLQKYFCRRKYLSSTLSDLDKLDGFEFEKYCKTIFEAQGYKVKLTPDSHDFGADLILTKDGIKTVVQAKRYKGIVGIAAVQQVIGSKEYYHADKCAVITNNYLSDSAKDLAKANNVTIYDRNYLRNLKKNK